MRRATCWLVTVLAASLAAPAAALGDRSASSSEIPGQYIVVLRDSVADVDRAVRARERTHSFRSRFRYRHTMKGFAARLGRGQVARLRRDAQVVAVVPDRRVEARGALASGDLAPTGVRRIEAGSASQVRGPSGVNVAVIDTGVDLSHADLNAVSGTDCVQPGTAAQDDEGHGTHVAGTIAARNNGSGVVGVAADTRIVAVKVLDSSGSGSWSQVICGIDWVTSTRTDEDTTNDIAVANMSLGGGGEPVEPCSATMSDPLHKAICNSTGAGVVYAVAAGNSGWDYDYGPVPDVPAAYGEVVTVTAASDTDGAPGGLGSSCSRQRDDRYASFSNYALKSASFPHTMAAPGVCITSTRLGGGTESLSGTSMATPHVAGALALCINDGGAAGPCAGMNANRPSEYIAQVTRTDSSYGFLGDPTRPLSGGQYFGYLGWVGLEAEPVEPDTTAPSAPTALTATAGDATVALDWANNSEGDLAGYHVYRSTTAGGDRVRLTQTPLSNSAYQDSGLTNGDTYYYVVTAVDTSGNESAASAEASATPEANEPGESFSLSAQGYKVKGVQHADLTWNGASSSEVDIRRNGSVVKTTGNDGAETDSTGVKGGGTATYQVCEKGTSTCSNEVTVTY